MHPSIPSRCKGTRVGLVDEQTTGPHNMRRYIWQRWESRYDIGMKYVNCLKKVITLRSMVIFFIIFFISKCKIRKHLKRCTNSSIHKEKILKGKSQEKTFFVQIIPFWQVKVWQNGNFLHSIDKVQLFAFFSRGISSRRTNFFSEWI